MATSKKITQYMSQNTALTQPNERKNVWGAMKTTLLDKAEI